MAISPQATRSLRRDKVKLPGGRTVTHYTKRKPNVAKCGICRKELKGIPRERPSVFRNLPYSQKTVSRAFGGNLCSFCSRQAVAKNFKDAKKFPFEVGRVCVKTAGRESGSICAVVDKLDNNFVLIDGQVKRRKCNIFHLETLDKKIDIKNNESSDAVKKELDKLGYELKENKKTKTKEEKTDKSLEKNLLEKTILEKDEKEKKPRKKTGTKKSEQKSTREKATKKRTAKKEPKQ